MIAMMPPTRARSCWTADGHRKRAYSSRRIAKQAALKGLAPYACAVHGWHLGHQRAGRIGHRAQVIAQASESTSP